VYSLKPGKNGDLIFNNEQSPTCESVGRHPFNNTVGGIYIALTIEDETFKNAAIKGKTDSEGYLEIKTTTANPSILVKGYECKEKQNWENGKIYTCTD
jgi:phosphatidate phosphatase APP1